MKRNVAIVWGAVLSSSCGLVGEDDFRIGLPTREMVEVKVPAAGGQSLESAEAIRQGLQGDKSGLYLVTRAATVTVNAGTVAILGLVKAVTNQRPTSLNNKTAVWGPRTEPLSPNTWRMTVTKTAAHTYSYVLEAKGKTEPDSAFRAILSGNHTSATNTAGRPQEGFGNGSFLLDFDQAATLPEHDDNVGTAEISYSRLSATADVAVDVNFHQVKDRPSTNLIDAKYSYKATPGSGGEFQFLTVKDLDTDKSRSKAETATIKSRWQETGAGRSDVRASGGDLVTPATMNECWDTNFLSRFFFWSLAPNQGWGSETGDCAFKTADYATL